MNEIIKAGRILWELRLNDSHSGNISKRSKNGFMITKTGTILGFLNKNDICPIDKFKKIPREASSESDIHKFIYGNSLTCNAIIHSHPVYATVLSYFYKHIKPFDYEGKLYFPNGIDVVEDRTQIDGDSGILILKNHGLFVWQNNMEKAIKLTSAAESSSRLIYKKLLLEKYNSF